MPPTSITSLSGASRVLDPAARTSTTGEAVGAAMPLVYANRLAGSAGVGSRPVAVREAQMSDARVKHLDHVREGRADKPAKVNLFETARFFADVWVLRAGQAQTPHLHA